MADDTGSFIWYELMTPDPAASKRFYDAVVGWAIDENSVAPGIDYRMIKRADGGNAGGVMTLTGAMQAQGTRPMWLGYLHVADVDQTTTAIRGDGGKVMMEPWDQPGVGRLALVTDPQGAIVYLMDPLPPEEQPDAKSDVFSVDRPQHVRWNELVSSDPDGAVAFYTRHFGMTQEGEMPMGDLGAYRFIQHEGVGIGAISGLMPGTTESRWTYYVGVEDIDRATAAVRDGGGQVVMGPHQIAGGEYSLIGVDPQGATFGLVGPRRNGEAA